MKKKILTLLLALTATFACALGFVACDEKGTDTGTGDNGTITTPSEPTEPNVPSVKENEELSFSLSQDGQSYIVTGIGSCKGSDLIIPSHHLNLPVTRIGAYAFQHCENLINITIPNTVTSIGAFAFQECYRLSSLTIPNSAEIHNLHPTNNYGVLC